MSIFQCDCAICRILRNDLASVMDKAIAFEVKKIYDAEMEQLIKGSGTGETPMGILNDETLK